MIRPSLKELKYVREKGTNRSKFFRGQVDKYSWIDAGSSMLLAEPLAAMLDGQLEHFDGTQSRRLAIRSRYDTELRDLCNQRNWTQPFVPAGCEHPAHLYYLIVRSLEERQSLLTHLRADGIQATFHYQPLHSSLAGRKFGRSVGRMTNTDIAADRLLRLPLWPEMTDEHVNRVVTFLQRYPS